MGFKPGHKKIEGSGRVKGQPNKKTLSLIQRCEERNFDPFDALMDIAKDPNTPIDLKINCLKDLCQYVHPRRKALEHSNLNQRLVDEAQNISQMDEKELLKVIEEEIKELKKE